MRGIFADAGMRRSEPRDPALQPGDDRRYGGSSRPSQECAGTPMQVEGGHVRVGPRLQIRLEAPGPGGLQETDSLARVSARRTTRQSHSGRYSKLP